MYLREVRIRNFKTYLNAKISLVDGLNIVTGPNGCGKSNIIDAIIFGLGESNPRVFRASSFSDLRTRLSGERSQRETSIAFTFSGEDGNDIFKLKRIIRPDGKMRYHVDGRKVSRKNYMNALLTYEERPVKHRYLAQGSVIRTAEMTAREIRRLLEDTVGVSVYDEKRDKALRLLEEADQKLRVSVAKIDEIRNNLMNLFKEALGASRKKLTQAEYGKLLASKKSLEIEDGERTLKEIEEKLSEVEEKREKLKERCRELEEEKERILRELQRLTEEIRTRGGERLVELEREKARLTSDRKTIDWIIGKEKERMDGFLKENKELKREAEEIRTAIRESRREIKNIEKEASANDGETQRLKAKSEELAEELERQLGEREKLISSSAGRAERKDKIFVKSVEKEAERRVSRLKREMLEIEIEGSDNRLRTLKSSVERIQRLLEELTKTRSRKREEIRTIKREIGDLKRRKKRLQKEIERAARIHDRAKSLHLKISVRKELQDKIAASAIDATKVLEVAKRGVIPEVRGLLRDLIKAPAEVRRLCGFVAEERWNSLVVDDWEAAEKVYGLSKKLNRKILLTVLSDYKKLGGSGSGKGKRTLSKYVKAPKNMDLLIKDLYGGTVMVKDLQEAFQKVLEGFDAIDEKGEFYVRKGVFRRGRPTEIMRMPRLPVKNLREVETAIREFGRMISLRKKDLTELDKKIEALNEELVVETGNIENIGGAIKAFRRNLATMRGIRNTLVERVKKTHEALNRAQSEEQRIDKDVKSLVDEVSEIEGSKLEDALRGIDEDTQKVRNLTARVNEEISRVKARNEALIERKRRVEEIVEKIFVPEVASKAAKRKNNSAKIRRTKVRVEERKIRRAEIEGTLKELEDKGITLEIQISEYKVRASERQEEANTLEEKVKTLYRDLDRLWRREAKLLEEKANISRELGKLRTELKVLGFEHPVQVGNPEVVEELIEELKEELREIGEVNPLAKSSYNPRAAIYKRFSKRRNELEREKNAVLDFIDGIDREKERVFMDGFRKINEKFRELFADMSPDGEAELIPENPDDVFEGGINIMVKFPLKPMVEMTSLSGGEKSIVVVSFLLALQTVELGGIYLFDEMDAHLDLRNSMRFTEVLKKSSKENQIVVVTLKPSIADAAEHLIGVTMRGGVSRVFPMPIKLLVQRES